MKKYELFALLDAAWEAWGEMAIRADIVSAVTRRMELSIDVLEWTQEWVRKTASS